MGLPTYDGTWRLAWNLLQVVVMAQTDSWARIGLLGQELVNRQSRSGGSGRALFMTPKRMPPGRIVDLLHRIGCLRQPCDLDLLLFCSRHPRAFLLSERLAEYVGYDLTQVMQSLETLITAGLLRRSPNSTHPAQLYVLTPGSPLGGWLSSLLRIAETRERRLAVLASLTNESSTRRPGGCECDTVGSGQWA